MLFHVNERAFLLLRFTPRLKKPAPLFQDGTLISEKLEYILLLPFYSLFSPPLFLDYI
jgi:hypothetical protein